MKGKNEKTLMLILLADGKTVRIDKDADQRNVDMFYKYIPSQKGGKK